MPGRLEHPDQHVRHSGGYTIGDKAVPIVLVGDHNMTNLPTRQGESVPAVEHAADEQAAIKAAGGWINLLARTLKTSRLYETGNPTAARPIPFAAPPGSLSNYRPAVPSYRSQGFAFSRPHSSRSVISVFLAG